MMFREDDLVTSERCDGERKKECFVVGKSWRENTVEELCRTKIEAVEMDNATKISLPTRYRPSACRYGPAVALLPVSKTKKRKKNLTLKMNIFFFSIQWIILAINFVVKNKYSFRTNEGWRNKFPNTTVCLSKIRDDSSLLVIIIYIFDPEKF